MRARPPATVLLERAQLIQVLAVLLPTILTVGLGVVLLALGSRSVALVAGVLVLAFCASSLVGYTLTAILVHRGASLARMQNEFLSAVSHELRTPLTSIQMYVETLEKGRVTDVDEQRECLGIVHRELRRMDGLVSRLLDLSRLQSGRHALGHGAVPVEGVVADAVMAFRAVALGDDVRLDVTVDPDLWIEGDRAALAQVIGNLLTNAWKYGPPVGKRIGLSAVAAARGQIEIAVVDNGPGVPLEERGRIFDHFERGRAAVDEGKPGVGLGLAIARAIVRAHGGSLRVDASPEGGARFVISLRRRSPGRSAEAAS